MARQRKTVKVDLNWIKDKDMAVLEPKKEVSIISDDIRDMFRNRGRGIRKKD